MASPNAAAQSCRHRFPAIEIPHAPEDPDYQPFNTNHWERIGVLGNINQLSGGLDINGPGKLKWIGSCQKHAGGIRFHATLEEVGEGQPSYASIFYAAMQTLIQRPATKCAFAPTPTLTPAKTVARSRCSIKALRFSSGM